MKPLKSYGLRGFLLFKIFRDELIKYMRNIARSYPILIFVFSPFLEIYKLWNKIAHQAHNRIHKLDLFLRLLIIGISIALPIFFPEFTGILISMRPDTLEKKLLNTFFYIILLSAPTSSVHLLVDPDYRLREDKKRERRDRQNIQDIRQLPENRLLFLANQLPPPIPEPDWESECKEWVTEQPRTMRKRARKSCTINDGF
jgi:hypothetical protein